MPEQPRRCGATIEGPKLSSGVVLWRKYCRAKPLRGFDHCIHHLTIEERERRRQNEGGGVMGVSPLLQRLRDKYPDDALQRVARSEYDYYSTHGDYLPELARLLLFEREQRVALVEAAQRIGSLPIRKRHHDADGALVAVDVRIPESLRVKLDAALVPFAGSAPEEKTSDE